MNAFPEQRIRGFELRAMPGNRGLIGLRIEERRDGEHQPPPVETVRPPATSGSFDALVTHLQARPASETVMVHRDVGASNVLVFGHATAILGRRPFADNVPDQAQAQRNAAAIALLNSWLAEDHGEASDEWTEIQGALDADRLSRRKLFR